MTFQLAGGSLGCADPHFVGEVHMAVPEPGNDNFASAIDRPCIAGNLGLQLLPWPDGGDLTFVNYHHGVLNGLGLGRGIDFASGKNKVFASRSIGERAVYERAKQQGEKEKGL